MSLQSALRHSIVAVALFAACGPPPAPPTPPPVPQAVLQHPALGCWEIRPDSAEPPLLNGEIHFRLDTVFDSWSEDHAVFKMIPGRGLSERPGMPRLAWWEPMAIGNSVRIGWGGALAGFAMRADIEGDSLSGWGMSSTDVGGASGTLRAIRGKRERCG